MQEKNKRVCLNCGISLIGKQKKYCSRNCFRRAIEDGKVIEKRNCPECGSEFIKKYRGHKYCSKYCASMQTKSLKTGEEVSNRPYTDETRYLIRLWKNKGDSLEHIAQALGRSIENVMMAFR